MWKAIFVASYALLCCLPSVSSFAIYPMSENLYKANTLLDFAQSYNDYHDFIKNLPEQQPPQPRKHQLRKGVKERMYYAHELISAAEIMVGCIYMPGIYPTALCPFDPRAVYLIEDEETVMNAVLELKRFQAKCRDSARHGVYNRLYQILEPPVLQMMAFLLLPRDDDPEVVFHSETEDFLAEDARPALDSIWRDLVNAPLVAHGNVVDPTPYALYFEPAQLYEYFVECRNDPYVECDDVRDACLFLGVGICLFFAGLAFGYFSTLHRWRRLRRRQR